MPKVVGNNRLSALRRSNNPYSLNNNRNATSFDARQLLTRQGSQTKDNGNTVVVTGLKDMKLKDGRLVSKTTTGDMDAEKKKKIFAVGPSTFVTIRNKNDNVNINQMNEKFSFTKTITNASARTEDDDRHSQTATPLSSLSDQKVVISFVNDKYQKTPTPPPPTSITTNTKSSSIATSKRLHDASMQTVSSSSSVSTRSPIRMHTHRRQNLTMADEDEYSSERTIADEIDESPVKRTTSFLRKTTTDRDEQTTSNVSVGSVKRTSTGVPISSRISSSVTAVTKKPVTTTQVVSAPGTILVTNLQSSVTEDDVIELFSDVGRITEIKTLSQGCVQITYAKREHSEQAVTKYHNRLLDGQFMYVCLQQPITTTTEKTKQISKTPTTTSNHSQQSTKETGTSASSSSTVNQPLRFNTNPSIKSTLDPTFIRQALFHPSNNSTNPVQFQVKL